MEEIHNFITPEECQELIKMIDTNHSRSSVVVGVQTEQMLLTIEHQAHQI